jgi:hypothetical protein
LPTLPGSTTKPETAFLKVISTFVALLSVRLIFLSKDNATVVLASTAWGLDSTLASSFEVAYPSWFSLPGSNIPSFEGLSAHSARLQGFELPKSPFCRGSL